MSARSWAKHAAGATAVVAAVALATSSAFARNQPPPSALSTIGSVAGTCHRDPDPQEFVTLSDTSPAVPCDSPHQTETAFQLTLMGELARQPSRPNPELLTPTYANECTNYYRIRHFLGARGPDVYWGLNTIARFPTPEEWAHGARVMDCDLYRLTKNGPSLNVELAGILARKDSAAFRLCRLGSMRVTCDQPHDAEATSPNVILPAGRWPGAASEAAEGGRACIPVVDAYLQGSIESMPGLAISATPLTAAQWASGDRSVDCWISMSGPPRTGTVRGGLR